MKFVLFCLKFNSSGLQSKQVFQFQCPHKLNTQNERERVKECVCVCEREGEREREERREESYDCFIHKLRESNTTHIDFGFSCSSPLKWVLITLTKLPISHKKLFRTPAKNSTRYCYSSKTRRVKNNPSKYQRQINSQYFDYKYINQLHDTAAIDLQLSLIIPFFLFYNFFEHFVKRPSFGPILEDQET